MSSITKHEASNNRFDLALWLVVVAIILGGVYANTQFVSVSVLIRAIAGIAIAGLAIGIALQTERGRATWELAKEARVEVRRVIWPNRQELTQTTIIVVIAVIVVGLLLWCIDSLFSWGVQSVIG